jgi:Putative metallopeptidase
MTPRHLGKRLRSAFGALILLNGAILTGATAAEKWEALPAHPDVTVAYVPPSNAQWQPIQGWLQQRKVLEELRTFIAPLRLPHPLALRTRQCDQINAFYNPAERSITLCYELVADVFRQAPTTVSSDGFITREAAIFGSVIGVLLHEGGHMVFDMLDVPRFGREEDAADQVALFLALQFNKDIASTIVRGFAYTWAVGSDPSSSAPISAWADEHGSASQRMYNALCLAYGGDPKTFAEFVDRGWLPKDRAADCADEYNQVKRAFVKTVLPFIDRGLMVRVQNAEWLTPEELK